MIIERRLDPQSFELIEGGEDFAASHKEAVKKLIEYITTKRNKAWIPVSTLSSFKTNAAVDGVLSFVGREIVTAYDANTFFDFGVVRNRTLIHLADMVTARPVEDLPWNGTSAVFVASHPEEAAFRNSLSVYLVSRKNNDLVMAESTYHAPNNTLLLGSLVRTVMPLTRPAQCQILGSVDGDQHGLANSVLSPVMMGCAFLRADADPSKAN